ncbi:MAG: bifunctional acetate--CoA ligase family protein/GNAT family N-acetyltransferase [Thermoflexales bacterium]|nr:bifunctional acetate--CoA ligase family protein/GNAT family N-acetyltransferase [Thermoflexales bacterium]
MSVGKLDPTRSDPLRSNRRALSAFFTPKTVAIIGATAKERSVGRALVENLTRANFKGEVYPINPKYEELLGVKTYPSVRETPKPVDLAVICTPPATVPGLIGECVDAGVKSAIVISAGFKEIGAAGVALEAEVMKQANRGAMRIIGPNCLGVMNPHVGLNATFAANIARPGKIAFISQSGALCTAVLDWSFRENVGFSRFVSVGSMLDVGWGDLIDTLAADDQTEAILVYMETIGDARAFMSAAREAALSKPIIIIKPGRTQQAAQAAASHTGSLAGSDAVLDAAFDRCGVLRVNAISDLFYMAEVLAKQPRPKGKRLTIITNAGGPGVLATDALITSGGQLAPISNEIIEKLNKVMPAAWSHNNPVDVLGDADEQRYFDAVDLAARDPNSDGLLVILTPQAMTNATPLAERLATISGKFPNPILASFMGGPVVEEGERILNQANIPTFGYPDTAARVFTYMAAFSENLKDLYETPEDDVERADMAESAGIDFDAALKFSPLRGGRETAREKLAAIRASGRTLLTELESKELLAAYDIPVSATRFAATEDEAVKYAEEVGYPVVLKLHSEIITHKTDVGGVQLNLRTEAGVRNAFKYIQQNVRNAMPTRPLAFLGVTVQPMVKLADSYEVILGSSLDPQFGPTLLFGSGGQLVEVYKDTALGLPPLNTTLARRMMEKTQIFEALKGVRGRRPVDLEAVERLLVRFSNLVAEQRAIKEIDINPLLVSPDGIIALDGRVVLHDPQIEEKDFPRLAIRPYPIRYMAPFRMKDGTQVIIRPIRPEDEPAVVEFHKGVSEASVYLRYFSNMPFDVRTSHDRLSRICFIDYAREMALVAEYEKDGQRSILGVGRLTQVRATREAEFALLVADAHQRSGLGTELLRRLVAIGKREGQKRIIGDILPENTGMQRAAQKLGFKIRYHDGIARAEMDIA